MKGKKKQWWKRLLCIVLGCTMLLPGTVPVLAYSSETADWKTMNKSGKFYFQIKGDGKTSKVWINVKHAKDIGWDYFTNNSSTWTCSLSGTNNHNIKLKVSSVKTKQSSDNAYTVFVFTLSYTQSAHYKKSSADYDKPDGLRLNYREYTKDGGNGDITSDAPLVHSNTTRNITIQVNSRCMGINNTDSKGGNKKLYTGCGTTLNFTRPNRTVTFANGYGGTVATKTVSDGTYVTAPGNPSRYGYNFTSWTGNIGAIVCANRTHTAQWTPWRHTVAYNANGGNGAPGNQTKTYGQSLSVSQTTPSRHGYNFKNWNTKQDGTGTAYGLGANYGYDQNGGTITLYAQWNPWKRTIAYNANGGSGSPGNQTKIYGQSLVVASQVPMKEGCEFVCWNTKQDGTGTSYLPGQVYGEEVVEDGELKTLYAQWKEIYRVQYEPGKDAKGTVSEQVQAVDKSVKLQKNGFALSEAKFMSWNLFKSGLVSPKKHMEGETVTRDQLREEAENIRGNAVSRMYAKTVKMSSQPASVKSMAENILPTNDFTMQAQWNHAPRLTLHDPITVLENEKVTGKTLRSLIKSCDDIDTNTEDKNIGIDDVKLVKIEYDKSSMDYQPQTKTFDDMPESERIDTYFKYLKKDETVDVHVTFRVEDTAGNVTEKTGIVHVKYNNPPVIKARDLGYFDSELFDAEKVLKEIQKNPSVTDKEDDEKDLKLEAVISDPEKFGKEEVKHLHRGPQAVTYSATDSLGKTSTLKVQVYIASSNVYENAPLRYSRFISKKFLNTLDEDSRWRTKEEYKEALETSLNRTEPVMTAEFRSGNVE